MIDEFIDHAHFSFDLDVPDPRYKSVEFAETSPGRTKRVRRQALRAAGDFPAKHQTQIPKSKAPNPDPEA